MCSSSKLNNSKLGLYTPLPINSHPLESIYMDFIGVLSMSWKGHDYLYVVVDHSKKMCALLLCKKHVTIEQTTNMFFQNVWVHFGLRTSIIYHRYSLFSRNFWSSVLKLMDTKLQKSTTFNPQNNGQTKEVSIKLMCLLQGCYGKHPKFWDEHLHYIQHAYNHAKHSYTQVSPFEACLGYLPKDPLDFIFGKNIVVD